MTLPKHTSITFNDHMHTCDDISINFILLSQYEKLHHGNQYIDNIAHR